MKWLGCTARWTLAAVILGLGSGQSALAGDHKDRTFSQFLSRLCQKKKSGADCAPCPMPEEFPQDCPTMPLPETAETPVPTLTEPTPSTPDQTPTPEPTPTTDPAPVDISSDAAVGEEFFASSASAESGQASSASFTPNLFGDTFATSSTAVTSINLPGALNGAPGRIFLADSIISNDVGTSFDVISPLQSLILVEVDNQIILADFNTFGNIQQTVPGAVPGIGGTITFDPNVVTIEQLNRALTNPVFQMLVQQQLLALEQSVDPNVQAVSTNSGVEASTSRGTAQFTTVTSNTGDLSYALDVTSLITQPVLLNITNPAGGGSVGRTKVSEDNNPLPRDRFIFNFDQYSQAAVSPDGWDIQRFSPGFEKTFFNRLMSIEARLPFASTLSSDFTDGIQTTAFELGNLHLTWKALLYGGEVFNVSAGLGLSVPTADDTHIMFNGTEVVRINNNTYLGTPYLALLYTPNNRVFAQVWGSASFDLNSNLVEGQVSSQGFGRAGRLTAQTLVSVDGQFGFWFYKSNTGILQALGPFIEMHYNTTVSDADVIDFNGIFLTDLRGSTDELNMTIGAVTQIGRNLNMSGGVVVPLSDEDDRFFDFQFGLRASYFFGPTGQARRPYDVVSNF